MTHTYQSEFAPGDEVQIDDGDRKMVGIVNTVAFDFRGELVEIAWWSNGEHRLAWFPVARIARCEDQ